MFRKQKHYNNYRQTYRCADAHNGDIQLVFENPKLNPEM